jgi:hypothetical protein
MDAYKWHCIAIPWKERLMALEQGDTKTMRYTIIAIAILIVILYFIYRLVIPAIRAGMRG